MNVLISGAGIAGPTLAYWLARHGSHATVVERHPEPRPGGQAVDFRGGPQLAVLERMGILPDIEKARTSPRPITIVNERGRRLSNLPAELFGGDVEILRGDLCRILYEATRNDAAYVFGDTITALAEEPDGVRVTFRESRPRTFDLVVGADGIHSAVRSLAFGDGFGHHLGMYAAVFTYPEPAHLMYSVPGRSATIQGSLAMLDFAAPELDVPHDDVRAQRALVAERFAGLGWKVPALLEAMREAADFYFAPATQIRMDRFTGGRVALLGDAGYAPGPGGMGTGLAVVAAYVLARELAVADPVTAAAAYESRIRPYVNVCQKQAQGGERFLVPRGRHQIWVRNQVMRLLPYVPGVRAMMSKAAEAFELDG